MLHIGLVVNPLAGLGGSLALKGSDGSELRTLARQQQQQGSLTRAAARCRRALEPLTQRLDVIRISTWGGAMGQQVCADLEIPAQVMGQPGSGLPSATDTRLAARSLLQANIDVLVFAGGDGTARDVHDAIGERFPVLGIPAGVKMHSGVFAVSPEAAGELLLELAAGGLVGLREQEVRDIDEAAFRKDVVRSRHYGQMLVPCEGRFLQHTKVGGREDQALASAEIAAWEVERMDADTLYLLGPGSTTAAIKQEFGITPTLLGVDAALGRELLAADADEHTLLALLQQHPRARIVVTAIGGQGHVFGRGNQQFSPTVIRTVGLANITLVAARSKLAALEGRPLLVDTDDPLLDRDLAGYRQVTCGYNDQLLYRLGAQY